MKTALAVGQLAFVNDQAGVHAVLGHRIQDLVERDQHFLEIRLKQPQRQISAGHLAWNRDFLAFDFLRRHGLHADQDGTVAVADARAAGHQDVLVGDVRIGVIGDRGQFVGAFHGLAVQGLNVVQHMAEVNQPRADLLGRQTIEHVSVVGIGAMRADDFRYGGGCHRRADHHYSRRAGSFRPPPRVIYKSPHIGLVMMQAMLVSKTGLMPICVVPPSDVGGSPARSYSVV